MDGDLIDHRIVDRSATLQQAFAAQGKVIAVSGNTPLELTGRDAVWLVAEGRVDVFLAIGASEFDRTRHYLATFEAGSLICGFAARDPERTLLAIGVGNASLLETTPAQFAEMVRPSDTADDGARRIADWVKSMAHAITRGWPRPALDQLLVVSGETILLADGARAAPGKSHVVWVSVSSGVALLLGFQELQREISEWFPLSEDSWIESCGDTTLITRSTSDLLDTPAIWTALRAFQSSIIHCSDFQQSAAHLDDLVRGQRQEESDRLLRDEALHGMAGALDAAPSTQSTPRPRRAVAAAATIVAREMGFSIDDDEEATDGAVGEVLAGIGRNARVRVRKVLLRDQWWRTDRGPLVAQFDDELRAIALVWSGSKYIAHDVARSMTLTVDGDVAGRISPHAFSLYRPLPSGSLRIRDLIRFASFASARDYSTFALITILWAIVGLVPPVVAGKIFDTVVPDRDIPLLVQLTVILLAVAFATAMFDVARKMAYLRLETRIGISIQSAVWDRLLALPIPFFRHYSSGELAFRANAIDAMRRTLTGVVVSGIVGGVFSAFMLALLFWYSATLALWAAMLGGIAAAVTVAAGILKVRFFTRVIDLQASLGGLILQMLNGIAKIRVAGAENRAFAVWAAAFARQKHFSARSARVDAALTTFNATFSIFASVVLFWLFLNILGRAGGLSIGDFVAFQYAFSTFIGTLVQMSHSVVQAIAVVPMFQQARPILEAMPESKDSRGAPAMMSGTIDVTHVSFSYDAESKPVLNDVTIHAGAREFVALVGPSGAGKSSIFRLLLGFETPTSGAIYYDGRDLAGLDLQKVRRNIGVVLQNGRIMSGDIFTNIVGSSQLTLEDAWEAARMAGFADDIRKMPMGMHTMLPEGATTLSGGQRQRLLIARALSLRPKLLLFDEATSALDNRTQEVINESLMRLDVTRVLIAHRLSTVRNADCIYVLDAGRVVESGSCEELLRSDGPFARLAQRQSLEEMQ